MNRLIKDPKIRRFITVEWGLLVVALALAYYTYGTYNRTGEALDERANFERRLQSSQGDLAALQAGATAAKLRAELETLNATPPPEFPPLLTALDFGTSITRFTSSQQLELKAYDVSSVMFEAPGGAKPAISYSVTLRGSLQGLVGVLSVPDGVPTAVIRELTFGSDPDEPDVWEMKMNVLVVHSGA